MLKNISILFVFVMILAAIFGFHYHQSLQKSKMIKAYRPPPISVQAEKISVDNWPKFIESIGNFRAIQSVDLSVQTSGIVKLIHFVSNQKVKKGQLLLALNTDALEAKLKANLATLTQVKINYKRILALLKQKAISDEAANKALAVYQVAQARVENTQAMIIQKKLYSPFDGVIGIRDVNLGQYFNPGDSVARLETVNPIHLEFSVSEENSREIAMGQTLHAFVDVFAGVIFKGKVSAIETRIDPENLGLKVQGIFPNDSGHLKSGMFANIKIVLKGDNPVLTLPTTAINDSLYGESVYIVTTSKKTSADKSLIVKRRTVKTGVRRGGKVSILRGVKKDELVVTLGQLKLYPGARVAVQHRKKKTP